MNVIDMNAAKLHEKHKRIIESNQILQMLYFFTSLSAAAAFNGGSTLSKNE